MLFVGPGDLAHSLGLHCPPDDPQLMERVAAVAAAAGRTARSAGVLVGTVRAGGAPTPRLGFTFLGCGSDGGLLVVDAARLARATGAKRSPDRAARPRRARIARMKMYVAGEWVDGRGGARDREPVVGRGRRHGARAPAPAEVERALAAAVEGAAEMAALTRWERSQILEPGRGPAGARGSRSSRARSRSRRESRSPRRAARSAAAPTCSACRRSRAPSCAARCCRWTRPPTAPASSAWHAARARAAWSSRSRRSTSRCCSSCTRSRPRSRPATR